ncbi:hypothetical protein T552_02137 [Pneumocystis carinii B80]|uniref:C2H2-type domain-containing protein n=1 Tax=Pneumocystis carinii (strain B80) TaxID=1408658 RepID=A0A0W4ZH62_PNEC8|nr:hypothetical protein T552_02137 [Pneumocystis carinii B80]KTW27697.1 hypothetical protein T552_02137 [Pneumocystis carinii B80]
MTNTNIERNHKKKVKNNKTFQCSGFGNCCMQFSRSEHLARHIRKHTGERPFKCYCGRTFSRLDNFRQHAQTIHINEVINSPYALSSNSLQTSTSKTQESVAKDDLTQSRMVTRKKKIKILRKTQEIYTIKPKNNTNHLSIDKITDSQEEDPPELSIFNSFTPNSFNSSDQIPDHYDSSNSLSSPSFLHSSIQNSLSPKAGPIPSNFSSDLDLGIKTIIPSDTNLPLPNGYQNIQSSWQEIHLKNDFLQEDNSFYNNSASITLYNNTTCTLTSSNTSNSSNKTNTLQFNNNKLPSITILMDYNLEPSNIITLSNNTNDYSLKQNNTQKMSIQFLCNQNITMGGIDILAEVAKIIN